MLLKEGPVTITTMKLKIQLDATPIHQCTAAVLQHIDAPVLSALAGARILSPTISAGCQHRSS